MSSALEQQIIFDYTANLWRTLQPEYGPIVMPNHKEPSAEGILYTSVVLIANGAARMRNSIGAPRLVRNRGYIFFTIYTPKDKGTLKAQQLKDRIVEAFDERVFLLPNGQRTVCGISEPQTLGLKDNLYRIIVNVPYYRDEW